MDSLVFPRCLYNPNSTPHHHHHRSYNPVFFSFLPCGCSVSVFQPRVQGTAGGHSRSQTDKPHPGKTTLMITVLVLLGKHSFSSFLTKKKTNRILLWPCPTALLLHHLPSTTATAIFGKENLIYAVPKHNSKLLSIEEIDFYLFTTHLGRVGPQNMNTVLASFSKLVRTIVPKSQ